MLISQAPQFGSSESFFSLRVENSSCIPSSDIKLMYFSVSWYFPQIIHSFLIHLKISEHEINIFLNKLWLLYIKHFYIWPDGNSEIIYYARDMSHLINHARYLSIYRLLLFTCYFCRTRAAFVAILRKSGERIFIYYKNLIIKIIL